MFLKRIVMQGFKSFADRVTIDFDSNLTGIVGPNGCGKSNIADAIRWVLGEQSVKSLRGEKMSDVIFSGSTDRQAQNFAEVSLFFDNTHKYLNSDKAELEVTRRIYSTAQEPEYLINRQRVRLKDVVDLVLDTGIGKDSLSMISQGNVQSFAEAKPLERRAVFEEAAGVAKYKKRKSESLNALNRTKENLERTADILNELEKQVTPLKKQAAKALLYREKKEKLKTVEIAVICQEIALLERQVKECKKVAFAAETKITMHKTAIQVHDNNTQELKAQTKELDKAINDLSERLFKAVNEIQILEKSKVQLDEKRKYALESGDPSEKKKQLAALLNDAQLAYTDRQKRFDKLKANAELLNTALENAAMALAQESIKKEESQAILRKLENRKELLKNLLANPFAAHGEQGVKVIMAAQAGLFGILGVIGQEIHAEKGYEEAVATALAGSIYQIITTDEKAARNAIAFLKRNNSGRATFLPLTVLKARFPKKEAELMAENFPDFCGYAADFVTCAAQYLPVVQALLANVFVVKDLKAANELAKLLNYQYKVVTLEGEIVHKGGAMSGGKSKNQISLITADAEFKDISFRIQSQKAQCLLNERKYSDLANQKQAVENNINENRLLLANLEPILEIKKAKYTKLKTEYAELMAETEGEKADDNTVIVALNHAYSRKDELTSALKLKREQRSRINNDIERLEQQIKQIRRELDRELDSEKNNLAIKAALTARLDNDLKRLSAEYGMTYEYATAHNDPTVSAHAQDEVKLLRAEIEALGNINMGAPEEFTKVNERFTKMQKDYHELLDSRDKILEAITKLDKVMISRFKETFDLINSELDNTFKALFGGGKAQLVLEDPADILDTGIDIDVQPPGKMITSIRLFSGGEKALIAICVLFTILKVRPVPLVLFDEVEAALDQANVERFAKYVKGFAKDSQFIIITHRPGTMAECDVLYGVTMQHRGVSQMLKVKLVDAIEMSDKKEVEG